MSGVPPDAIDDAANLQRISALERIAAPHYDQVLYVDAGNGDDTLTGKDWVHALKTVNGAMAVLNGLGYSDVRGRHYAVIFRGRLTGGNAMPANQIINVAGVHLLGAGMLYGMGGGWDSCFVTKGSLLNANTDYSGLRVTRAGLEIQTDDVLVAGLKFYAADIGNPFYHVAIDDAKGGRNCAVLSNVLQGDVNGAQNVYGVGFNGCETGLAKDNLAYYLKEAVTLGGGGTRYCHQVAVENLKAEACERIVAAINSSTQNCWVQKVLGINKTTYGFALVAGIDFTGSGNGHNVVDCYMGTTTKAVAYTPGAGSHFWHNDWYATTNGADVQYDGT